ncbi:MAG: protein-L-isoaspartate(D-aspartate) O-methyltransferase [Methanomicrobiales archaeon]|nr:protein-L-isoaspartate(D-aspartate) O-methyltransferase [Methanomicrobiales archaeon]
MDDERGSALRERMVRDQIASRGIGNPRVLAAMRAVPRHRFVPAAVQESAYEDRPLPIGEGQTISQPYIVALMTDLLDPGPGEKVLEIGAGSGYQAAILSRLAAQVVSIERLPDIAEGARRNLAALGISNVEVIVADGTEGYPEKAPYDAIIITAAAPSVPPPLLDQLAEGGRLVAPVGDIMVQTLVVVEKKGGKTTTRSYGGVCFVPLIGAYGWHD